jgi:hypothetical protein
MKTTSAEHGQIMFCACSFHENSMNNLLPYCGLVDAKIIASDKYLPVPATPNPELNVIIGTVFCSTSHL